MSVKPTVLKRPENDVTKTQHHGPQRHRAGNSAYTRYVEGGGIRFAYRQLWPVDRNRRWFCRQHFLGLRIDAWDPAVVNTLAADRQVDRFRQRRGRPFERPNVTMSQRWPRTRSAFINLLDLSEVDPAGLFPRRLRRPADRRRARSAGPPADPRRYRSKRQRRTSASDSAGRVFANRRAGSPLAAILYEIVRQPVGRPGIPEAG